MGRSIFVEVSKKHVTVTDENSNNTELLKTRNVSTCTSKNITENIGDKLVVERFYINVSIKGYESIIVKNHIGKYRHGLKKYNNVFAILCMCALIFIVLPMLVMIILEHNGTIFDTRIGVNETMRNYDSIVSHNSKYLVDFSGTYCSFQRKNQETYKWGDSFKIAGQKTRHATAYCRVKQTADNVYILDSYDTLLWSALTNTTVYPYHVFKNGVHLRLFDNGTFAIVENNVNKIIEILF